MTTHFASNFETRTRDNGVTYVTLADSRPEWLQDAVREAHQGDLPNDWVYAECQAAVEAIDAGDLDLTDKDDDDVHAHADGRVDIYTRDLFQWAADFCLTETWACALQEAKDMGMRDGELEKQIAVVQYTALRHIADVMKQACTNAVLKRDHEDMTADEALLAEGKDPTE